jgi:hypothetical protein
MTEEPRAINLMFLVFSRGAIARAKTPTNGKRMVRVSKFIE